MRDPFVATPEAAFIAGVSDREMNRAVDEHILPEVLIRNHNGRRFARLGAALAGFYFKTEDVYVASLRRKVVDTLMARLKGHGGDQEEIFALRLDRAREFDWCIDVAGVSLGHLSVDVSAFVSEAKRRIADIESALELITTDPEVMGGMPVFAGTRVPVEPVLASVKKGIEHKRIEAAYPFLTDKHLEAARVYVSVHPRRGRPSKAASSLSSWKVKSSRRATPRDAKA